MSLSRFTIVMGTKISVPSRAPRKMLMSVPFQPTKAPTIAIIFTSPPPIASFLNAISPSHPMSQRSAKPTAAPMSAFTSIGIPPTAASTSPMTRPPMLKGDPQHASDEHRTTDRQELEAEAAEHQAIDEPQRDIHQRIHHVDREHAQAAFSAEQQPGEDRAVVIRPEPSEIPCTACSP